MSLEEVAPEHERHSDFPWLDFYYALGELTRNKGAEVIPGVDSLHTYFFPAAAVQHAGFSETTAIGLSFGDHGEGGGPALGIVTAELGRDATSPEMYQWRCEQLFAHPDNVAWFARVTLVWIGVGVVNADTYIHSYIGTRMSVGFDPRTPEEALDMFEQFDAFEAMQKNLTAQDEAEDIIAMLALI